MCDVDHRGTATGSSPCVARRANPRLLPGAAEPPIPCAGVVVACCHRRALRRSHRRTCPQGHQPEVATRIFGGVMQPVAIGLFAKRADNDPSVPATVHDRALHGRRAAKFDELKRLDLDSRIRLLSLLNWDPRRAVSGLLVLGRGGGVLLRSAPPPGERPPQVGPTGRRSREARSR